MDWQDIATAPKDGSWIVALTPESIEEGNPTPFIFTTRWVVETHESWEQIDRDTQKRRVDDWSHWHGYESPTHWMPLPPLPGSDAEFVSIKREVME